MKYKIGDIIIYGNRIDKIIGTVRQGSPNNMVEGYYLDTLSEFGMVGWIDIEAIEKHCEIATVDKVIDMLINSNIIQDNIPKAIDFLLLSDLTKTQQSKIMDYIERN